MTLVERFIEISRWPTSRRVVVWNCLLMLTHVATIAAGYWADSHLDFLDSQSLLTYTWAWLGVIALCTLVSLPSALAGRESVWTAYLIGLTYGVMTVGCIHLLGTSSTPLVVLIPLAALLIAVALDVHAGIWSLALMLVLLLLVVFLESSHLIPYAPLLTDRSIDAQVSGHWFFISQQYVLQGSLVVFAVIVLLVLANRSQGEQLKRVHQLIRRYVPSQVAEAIVASGGKVEERHERRKLTIFFSDLVGFTDISEEMEPEDLSRILNEYFSEMTRIAAKHGGTVDELAGDAVLIFFGAPHATDDKDHALRAVRMAIEMQQSVTELNEKWKSAGIDVALKVRMGLNTGVVTIGNFGSPERMKYSALGKHANVAARLQSHCEPGRVLLSHPTWLLVQDQIPCQPKGELSLKGIAKPVMAYEISPPA